MVESLGPRGWQDVLEMAGDTISIVKLGWGTAAVTQNLERKLEVLKAKPVVIGGTFFEVVYVKDAFDEEIKKSWEEYSDQVGREVAESTSYFKEALNEILAGGRQIF